MNKTINDILKWCVWKHNNLMNGERSYTDIEKIMESKFYPKAIKEITELYGGEVLSVSEIEGTITKYVEGLKKSLSTSKKIKSRHYKYLAEVLHSQMLMRKKISKGEQYWKDRADENYNLAQKEIYKNALLREELSESRKKK